VFSYGVLRLQHHLALNPDHLKAVSPRPSLNTSVSFLTTTNWQSYAGESTMSHLSQMVALVVRQFLAGAVGMAVVVAFIRALVRRPGSALAPSAVRSAPDQQRLQRIFGFLGHQGDHFVMGVEDRVPSWDDDPMLPNDCDDGGVPRHIQLGKGPAFGG
jgi:hypothetical protein